MSSVTEWFKASFGIKNSKPKADESANNIKEFIDPNQALTDAVMNELGCLL